MIIDLIQGTPEWLDYRKGVLTASEAPVVLNKSPWCTPEVMRLRKLGRHPEPEMTPRMQYGHDMEESIRQRAESRLGKMFFPICCSWSENPYFFASLDGRSEDGETILEVKTCGSYDFDRASMGIIPEHYRIQVQQQLLCSGAKECWIVMSHGAKDTYVSILPDRELQQQIVAAGLDFKRHLEEDISYNVVDEERDFMNLLNISDLLETRASLKDEADVLKSKIDEITKEIDSLLSKDEMTINGYHIKRSERVLYDYKQCCVDNAIDVSLYSKPSNVLSIRKIKDSDK